MAFDTEDTNTIVTLHSSGGQNLLWMFQMVSEVVKTNRWMENLVKNRNEVEFGDMWNQRAMERHENIHIVLMCMVSWYGCEKVRLKSHYAMICDFPCGA